MFELFQIFLRCFLLSCGFIGLVIMLLCTAIVIFTTVKNGKISIDINIKNNETS